MRHSALAFIVPLTADEEPVVKVLEDPDAFDPDDCSIYSDSSGDTGSVAEMIEQAFVCDCGNDAFAFNRCTQCGAPAPWASKYGCGPA